MYCPFVVSSALRDLATTWRTFAVMMLVVFYCLLLLSIVTDERPSASSPFTPFLVHSVQRPS
jgi:hypothetical protein